MEIQASEVEELERAKRDLEDFIYMASHDLKAPLLTIQGFCTILEEDYADKLAETGRKYLELMKKAAERMTALIVDLLNVSRVGREFIAVETVDLNELLDEIKSDLWARLRERGGEVVAGKLPTISVQRVWMKELLINLIDNGLKYNRAEKPRVEVSCEEEGGKYVFKVKDNGIGIEEKDQEKIFRPFERLHPQSEYEGTGLGLLICKRIVDNFGGKIRFDSKPGEGSTFCFSIPKTS